MAIVFVKKKKYKIFKKAPKYGVKGQGNKRTKTFTYTTNNPKHRRGIIARKGNQVRYE